MMNSTALWKHKRQSPTGLFVSYVPVGRKDDTSVAAGSIGTDLRAALLTEQKDTKPKPSAVSVTVSQHKGANVFAFDSSGEEIDDEIDRDLMAKLLTQEDDTKQSPNHFLEPKDRSVFSFGSSDDEEENVSLARKPIRINVGSRNPRRKGRTVSVATTKNTTSTRPHKRVLPSSDGTTNLSADDNMEVTSIMVLKKRRVTLDENIMPFKMPQYKVRGARMCVEEWVEASEDTVDYLQELAAFTQRPDVNAHFMSPKRKRSVPRGSTKVLTVLVGGVRVEQIEWNDHN